MTTLCCSGYVGVDRSLRRALVAPQSVIDALGSIPLKKITRLDNGHKTEYKGIGIPAIPMYNLPDDETIRHRPGWGNGYVLTIHGTRIYISGDTEDIPEMRAREDHEYAFVCIHMPDTMTIEQKADAVLEFGPKVVYPFQYRGKGGFSDAEKFRDLVLVHPSMKVRLRDWHAKG